MLKPPLPPEIERILAEIARYRLPRGEAEDMAPRWQAALEQVSCIVPGVTVAEGGEIVHLGGLSPGCQACKDGCWDIVFITMRCNLSCAFCYSPLRLPPEHAGSVYGATPEEMVARYRALGIRGVGLSGGEPFLELERLLDWLQRFKRLYPQAYYWVYTNGVLADEAALRRLAELGLDEIRFNLAATGYDHPQVLANLSAAARLLPQVTVEIPAIPADADKLLACLPVWAALGVRTLNLHELIYEPGTPSEHMPGERVALCAPDGRRVLTHPGSRRLALKVLAQVAEQGLPLRVNDCSLQSKFRQVRGRRRNIYALLRPETEKLVEDREYETVCAFRGAGLLFIHPDEYPAARRRMQGYRFIRLRRLAPLALQSPPQWVDWEELGEDAAG